MNKKITLRIKNLFQFTMRTAATICVVLGLLLLSGNILSERERNNRREGSLRGRNRRLGRNRPRNGGTTRKSSFISPRERNKQNEDASARSFETPTKAAALGRCQPQLLEGVLSIRCTDFQEETTQTPVTTMSTTAAVPNNTFGELYRWIHRYPNTAYRWLRAMRILPKFAVTRILFRTFYDIAERRAAVLHGQKKSDRLALQRQRKRRRKQKTPLYADPNSGLPPQRSRRETRRGSSDEKRFRHTARGDRKNSGTQGTQGKKTPTNHARRKTGRKHHSSSDDQSGEEGFYDINFGLIQPRKHTPSPFVVHDRSRDLAKEPIYFEPITQLKLTRARFKVTTFVDFTPYEQSLQAMDNFLQVLVDNVKKLVGQTSSEGTTKVMIGSRVIQVPPVTPCDLEAIDGPGEDRLCKPDRFDTPCMRKLLRKNLQPEGPWRTLDWYQQVGKVTMQDLYLFEFRCNDVDKKWEQERIRRVYRRNQEFSKAKRLASVNTISRITAAEGTLQLLSGTLSEINDLNDFFREVRKKYDSSLDHLRTHPTAEKQTPPGKRRKRSFWTSLGKAFNPVSNLLGGIFGSSEVDEETIKQIQHNLKVLQSGVNSNREEIRQNLAAINLTRIEVGENRKTINALQRNLLEVNYTLSQTAHHLQETQRKLMTLVSVQHQVSVVRTGLSRIQLDLLHLSDYLSAISLRRVTPGILPPPDLRDLLLEIESDLASHPKLQLPEDPERNIWAFYPLLRLFPIVLSDHLVLMMDLPLVDRTAKLQVLRAHPYKILAPDIQKAFSYQLEAPYLALTEDQRFVSLLSEADVVSCTINQAATCRLQVPMYPVKTVNWCILSLLLNHQEKIDRNCKITAVTSDHAVASYLGHQHWIVSGARQEVMHIQCPNHEQRIEIDQQVQIVPLPNGCSAYSNSLYIPAYTDLAKDEGNITSKEFIGFSSKPTPIIDYKMIQDFPIHKLTEEQIARQVNLLPDLKDVTKGRIIKELEQINNTYPYHMPRWLSLLIAICSSFLFTLIIVAVVYLIYRKRWLCFKTVALTSGVGVSGSLLKKAAKGALRKPPKPPPRTSSTLSASLLTLKDGKMADGTTTSDVPKLQTHEGPSPHQNLYSSPPDEQKTDKVPIYPALMDAPKPTPDHEPAIPTAPPLTDSTLRETIPAPHRPVIKATADTIRSALEDAGFKFPQRKKKTNLNVSFQDSRKTTSKQTPFPLSVKFTKGEDTTGDQDSVHIQGLAP